MLTSTVEEEVGDDSLKEYNYKLYLSFYVVFCTVYGHLVQLTSTTTTTCLIVKEGRNTG